MRAASLRLSILCSATFLITACKSHEDITASSLANCLSKNLHHHNIANSREYYEMMTEIETKLLAESNLSDVNKNQYHHLSELLEKPENKLRLERLLSETSKKYHFDFDEPSFLRAFNDCPKETLIRTANDPEGSLMLYINMIDAFMRGETINTDHLRSMIKKMTEEEFKRIEYRALILQLYILDQNDR